MRNGARPGQLVGLVIFDCDGVIVDSEPIGARVVSANLTRHGWPMTPEAFNELFLGGTILAIHQQARERGLDLADDWPDEVYAEMFAALERTRPIPGIVAVLDALEASGAPYCIGSNGPQAKMDVTLKATGLAPRFEGRRFSAREVALPKPAPDLFLHAAERMGVPVSSCVVVGDSPNDANAARAAGMPCFGFASEISPEIFRSLGARPFTEMAALPALLGL